MGLDTLHRTTLDVMCVVAWHIAGASFLGTALSAGLGGTAIESVQQQILGAVFVVSFFVAIGTSVRLWMHQIQTRRRDERLGREGQRI